MKRFGVFFMQAFLGILAVFLPFFLQNIVHGADLLDEVMNPSKQNAQVIDIGNNKNAVGNELFKPTYDIVRGEWRQPLIVRIIKTILQITMILGVTMGIFVGVQYVYSQGDEAKTKKLIGYLWNIAIGIILALSAYAIVELVQSVTRSSITL